MNDIFEYTDQEIKDAIEFVIRDNQGKSMNMKEFKKLVETHLMEDTVIKNIEQLKKDGFIEEIAPDQFVVTQKGLELEKEMKSMGEN